MADRPEPDYNCTQLELYAVCRIGLSSYREQLADFTNFKAFYNETWGNDFEAAIEAAAKLPDFQARDEASEEAGIFLGKKAKECTNKWQDLKRYITTTTNWGEIQKPKLEAAGSTLYEKAANDNWEVLKGLMITASNFIDNNEAALEADGNMPNAFKGQFNTLKDDYSDLYDEFTDAEQDSKGGTDEKINANNGINKTVNTMFGDGQAIYRENAAMQDRFIFDTVLKIVRGSKGKTVTKDIAAQSRVFVERVVKNSEITNTGQVDLLLDVGNVETPTPQAITIPVDGAITRPDKGTEVSVFNTDETNEGQFSIRVTVD